MEKKLTIDDFINKYKTFEIWDFIFKEPTIQQTKDLKFFYDEWVKENIDEFEFYYWFLEKLLNKWDKDKLKEDLFDMPINQATKFFFYVLEQLGINFSKTLSKSFEQSQK